MKSAKLKQGRRRGQENQSYCCGTELLPSGSQAKMCWVESGSDVLCYQPERELADTRKLIWSKNTAAPQESTNDSGSSTTTTLAPAHTKIMSTRMERQHTDTLTHIQYSTSVWLFVARTNTARFMCTISLLRWKHPHKHYNKASSACTHTPTQADLKSVLLKAISFLWCWPCSPSWWVSQHPFGEKKKQPIQRENQSSK